MKIIQTNFSYRKPLIPLSVENVEYIIIHHPAWENASAEMIHIDVLNDPKKVTWCGFPYNEYIRSDGVVYIGRGDHIGSQCANMNSKSYGISFEGNFDIREEMPQEQFESGIERLLFHVKRFPNLKGIMPHKAFANTSCPGKFFPINELISRVYGEIDIDKEHWAQKPFDELIKKGVVIHDKRFNDTVTRGELFALLNQIVKG